MPSSASLEEEPSHIANHTQSHSRSGSTNGVRKIASDQSTTSSSKFPPTRAAPAVVLPPAAPSRDASLHARFSYVLDCAKTAGFDDFDANCTALTDHAHPSPG